MTTFRDRAVDYDSTDPLGSLPDRYHHPQDLLYFDGNSLGLMSDRARSYVEEALDAWGSHGVMGWNQGSRPWFTWAEDISNQLGTLMGAEEGEITLGASTTVMLHQLLATFYRPQDLGQKILIDELAFPTDRYAVDSFLASRGLLAKTHRLTIATDVSRHLSIDAILAQADQGVRLAVLPSVVFTTGQQLPMAEITTKLRSKGILVIWDLSHSAGLIPHQLHRDAIDAAVFCTYKYLNGGPGAPGGAFVHRSHLPISPGMGGWWGSANDQQFHMPEEFFGASTAHALQLGTPSILSLAALAGSVSLLAEVGITALYDRSTRLVEFLHELFCERLEPLGISCVTPLSAPNRGGHLALVHPYAREISLALRQNGVIPDFRYPDIIRLAPVPTTTRFSDCVDAVERLRTIVETKAFLQHLDTPSDVV